MKLSTEKETIFIGHLTGSYKQIIWAGDIKLSIYRLLEEMKLQRPEVADDYDIILNNIYKLTDSAYIIENLREVRSNRTKPKKLNALIDWVIYTEHEDFKNIDVEKLK